MTIISRLLDIKDNKVTSVGPDDTVLTALQVMEKKDIGAVVVMEGERIVGLFSERLYARKVFLKGKASPTTLIREVMSDNVCVVRPDHTVEECMAIMTERHIRHLPVIEDGKLIGIVSIGDLVKSIISDQQFTIEQLETYIRA